jgi:hypothetical protein
VYKRVARYFEVYAAHKPQLQGTIILGQLKENLFPQANHGIENAKTPFAGGLGTDGIEVLDLLIEIGKWDLASGGYQDGTRLRPFEGGWGVLPQVLHGVSQSWGYRFIPAVPVTGILERSRLAWYG